MDSITDLRRATLYRDGLMVGLLIARPLRLRTFIAIELERHLVMRRDGFLLRFAPEDMKDKKAHEYAVPTELVEPLQRYLGFTVRTCFKTNQASASGSHEMVARSRMGVFSASCRRSLFGS
jgi:hypothetical protein